MKLDVCTLSSEAVVNELKQKQKLFEETVFNFKVTDEDSLVILALLHTALHLCKVVAPDYFFRYLQPLLLSSPTVITL